MEFCLESTNQFIKDILWISDEDFITGSYGMEENCVILWKVINQNIEIEITKKEKIEGDCMDMKVYKNEIYILTSKGNINIYSKDLKKKEEIDITESILNSIDRNESFIYTAGEAGKLHIISKDKIIEKYDISNDPIQKIQVKNQEIMILSSSIKIFNLNDLKKVKYHIYLQDEKDILFLSGHYHPQQPYIIAGTNNGVIAFWDIQSSTPNLLKKWKKDIDLIWKCQFQPLEKKFYYSTESGNFIQIDYENIDSKKKDFNDSKIIFHYESLNSIDSFDIKDESHILLASDNGQIFWLKN